MNGLVEGTEREVIGVNKVKSLVILAIVLGWLVLGFINTRIRHYLIKEREDIGSFAFCTLFAPILFLLLIFYWISKWLFKLYEKIFY